MVLDKITFNNPDVTYAGTNLICRDNCPHCPTTNNHDSPLSQLRLPLVPNTWKKSLRGISLNHLNDCLLE